MQPVGQVLPGQAELPVDENDRWFRILAESTSTAIFVYRADSVLYVNPACAELTGYSSQELLAMKPGDMAAPEFQELLRERAAARLRGQPVPNRYEVRIFTKDGRERWFDMTSAYIAIDDGEPVALATAVDITDRKLGEERLRAIVEGTSSTIGADFLRSLVRHLAGALGMEYASVSEVCDQTVTRVRMLALWEIDHYSPPFEYDLRGTPCEQVVGRQISFHPSGVWQLFPEDRWLVATRIESYIAVPLFDRAERPLGHIAVMSTSPVGEDVPALSILKIFAARAAAEIERKLTEDALAKEKELAQVTLASIGDGVIRTDAAGVVDYLNPVAERLTGWELAEACGLPVTRDLQRRRREQRQAAAQRRRALPRRGAGHRAHRLLHAGAARRPGVRHPRFRGARSRTARGAPPAASWCSRTSPSSAAWSAR